MEGYSIFADDVVSAIDSVTRHPDNYTLDAVTDTGRALLAQRAHEAEIISLIAEYPWDEYFALACLIAFQSLVDGIHLVAGGAELPDSGVGASSRQLDGAKLLMLRSPLAAAPGNLRDAKEADLPPVARTTTPYPEKRRGFWGRLLGDRRSGTEGE